MKFSKIICVLAGAMLLAVGCSDDTTPGGSADETTFSQKTEMGVYGAAGAEYFVFDYPTCQHAFSATKKSGRIQKDDMSVYADVTITKGEIGTDDTVTARMTIVGIANLGTGTAQVKVVKTEGNKVWLWRADKATGFIIPWEL